MVSNKDIDLYRDPRLLWWRRKGKSDGNDQNSVQKWITSTGNWDRCQKVYLGNNSYGVKGVNSHSIQRKTPGPHNSLHRPRGYVTNLSCAQSTYIFCDYLKR